VEATSGVGQLEGPQEVRGLLEVGANSVDLVDQILEADNAVLAERVLDDLVVGQSNTLLVDLAVSTLVDELADGLQVRITEGDVRVDDGEHLGGGLVQANENTVVDLKKSEKLKDLAGFRRDLVDTLDTDDEDKLGLLENVVAAFLSALASKTDFLTLSIAVLLDVGFGALEDNLALLLVGLLHLLDLSATSGAGLLLALALLQECLRDEDLVLSGNGTVSLRIEGQYSLSKRTVSKGRRV